MTRADVLFDHDGSSTYLPTIASTGPWNPDFLHGGAVSALLAGLLDDEDQVMVRVLIELQGPVPHAPLRAEVRPAEGGRKVIRQAATLHAGERLVACAFALRMRRADTDLPEAATAHQIRFDPTSVPDLTTPNRAAARAVGWDSFDSLAMAAHIERGAEGERVRMWNRLLLPVVPERPASPIEQTVAACDNAVGVSARMDFRTWSWVNADLVVSLSRPPVAGWTALESEGYLGHTGTGQAVSTIHDAAGPLGQKSQSVLLDRRPSPEG